MVLGVVLLGLAVLGAALKWSEAVMIALLPFGLFVLVFGIVGVMPSGNWKEGNFQWPEKDLLARVDELARRVDQLDEGFAGLLRQSQTTDQHLTDVVMAIEPAPDDGLTDQERLGELEELLNSTDMVVSTMAMQGSGYEDGSSYEDWRASLEKIRAAFEHEERRQAARQKYRDLHPER